MKCCVVESIQAGFFYFDSNISYNMISFSL